MADLFLCNVNRLQKKKKWKSLRLKTIRLSEFKHKKGKLNIMLIVVTLKCKKSFKKH